MATTIVYEPQYELPGWFDDGGLSAVSWFDRDLAGTLISLVRAQPVLLPSASVIYTPPPVEVQVLPGFFVNVSTFFKPTSVRLFTIPDEVIKNEVRRV